MNGRGGKPITGVEDTLVGLSTAMPAPVATTTPHGAPSPSVTTTTLDGVTTPPAGAQTVGDRYQIVGLVGVGGMGRVYRVHDRLLDEHVALKLLRSDVVDTPGAVERFRQEVKLARRVTHHNVARVFDLGEHAGQAFLTMELIDGRPLSHLVAEHPTGIPLPRLAGIARQLTTALGAAHAVGVIHRDLKPDNILLGPEERVVVTDFGIARALTAPGGSTSATLGTGVGTPAYMAPEQVDASAPADARADIYALGAILYELATGARAWPGDGALAVAAARLMQPPPDPRLRRGLPDALAELILVCLARRTEQRYGSAGEVAAQLDVVDSALLQWAPTPMPGATSTPSSLGLRALASPGRAAATPAAALRPPATPRPLPTPPSARTIAVLPIVNQGPADDDYLADALSEDLIDRLSMARGLKVRSRGAVLHLRGDTRDPRDIGHELGVDVVASGSLRRSPAGLRVTLRLTGVADGFQLWAQRYDRPATAALDIDALAATEIARALTADAPAHREVPQDPIALDLYLRGRHEYNSFRRDKMERATELYRQALLRAPDDPTILTAYALACVRLWFLIGGPEGARHADEARTTARRALDLAPHRAEPLVASACVHMHDGDTTLAVHELSRSLRIDPDLVIAHEFLGRILIEIGRPDAGIVHLTTALALDPFVPAVRWEITRVQELLGHHAEVDAQFEQPVSNDNETTGRVLTFARIAFWRRDPRLCMRLLQGTRTDSPPVLLARSLGQMLAATDDGADDPAQARGFVARLDTMASGLISNPRQRALMHQLRTEVAGYYGEADLAAEALAKADACNLIDIVWLDSCPLLAPLRAHPDFARLRAPVAERAARAAAAYDVPAW